MVAEAHAEEGDDSIPRPDSKSKATKVMGQLAKSTMPEQRRDRLETLDADLESGVTLEAFQRGFHQTLQGRAGHRSGQGGAQRQSERPSGEQ